MKRLFLLVMLIVTPFAAQSESIDEAIEILKYVESDYDSEALGDWRGNTPTAFGILQIRKIAVDDVNRIYGTNYSHHDAFDISCSEEIFKLYTKYWSTRLEKREGRRATTQDIVRIWNGGPRGYKRNSTQWYLKKFLKYKSKRYLCKNENNTKQTKMPNIREIRYSYQTVYTYSGCFYLYDS